MFDVASGTFERSHMQYDLDRPLDRFGEPSLADMVQTAIEILNKDEDGYFLFVEGGRIDHAHHSNNAIRAMQDTVALSDAVQRAMDLTDEDDTLIVLTADHSHVFTMAGYSRIDTEIMGDQTVTVALIIILQLIHFKNIILFKDSILIRK